MSGSCNSNPEKPDQKFLGDLEDQTLSKLIEKQPSISSSDIAEIKKYFSGARNASVRISEVSLKKLWEPQWALLGINQRAYHLTMATLQQINEGNFVACGHSVRGVLETLSTLLWVEQKPDRLPSLVGFQALTIGKLMNCSYTAYPKLKERYKLWSSVTHPGRLSNLLCPPGMAATERGMVWPITFGFSKAFASLVLDDLIIFCFLINKHVDQFIISNEEFLRSGKIMVKSRKE